LINIGRQLQWAKEDSGQILLAERQNFNGTLITHKLMSSHCTNNMIRSHDCMNIQITKSRENSCHSYIVYWYKGVSERRNLITGLSIKKVCKIYCDKLIFS